MRQKSNFAVKLPTGLLNFIGASKKLLNVIKLWNKCGL